MKYLILSLALLLSGACATGLSSNETSVIISSTPAGKNFSVTNKAGEVVHQGVTPETVMLNNSADFFEAEAYKLKVGNSTVNVDGKMSAIYYGNIFGLVGFIVDPITGSMWNLPDTVKVTGGKAEVKYTADTLD
jgi:hypothetical protein